MDNKERIEEILTYWFGSADEIALPSSHRTEIWLGFTDQINTEIKDKFYEDWKKAVAGEYNDWKDQPHGCLALIIILDQFSRHIFYKQPQAYAQDQNALDLCMQGIQKEFDHTLSLIERVFFYFPLIHAENLEMQATAVRAYQILVNLSFTETRMIYENFLDYAIKQYEVIRRFGHFPQRNTILERPSTPEELEFLKNTKNLES